MNAVATNVYKWVMLFFNIIKIKTAVLNIYAA